MTNAALAVEAVPVALLGRNDACRTQLKQALIELGAEIVHEGELFGADCATIVGVRPAVVLINLEAGSEDMLDMLDPLLGDPAINVVFNEAESTSQLAGWDLARWARHLAAKVLGHGNTVPPPPPGSEQLPPRDLTPRPGPVPTPAQEIGDVPLDGFAAEAADSLSTVPASHDLTAGRRTEDAAAADAGELPMVERLDALHATPGMADSAGDPDQAVRVAVVRDLHEGVTTDAGFALDLDEIEQALAGLGNDNSAVAAATDTTADTSTVDVDDFAPLAGMPDGTPQPIADGELDTFDEPADELTDELTFEGASDADGAMGTIYDPDAADVDLSLDPDVAALAAQLDANAADGGLSIDDSGLDLEFDFSAAAVDAARDAPSPDLPLPADDSGESLDIGGLDFDFEHQTDSADADVAAATPGAAGPGADELAAPAAADAFGLPSLDFELPPAPATAASAPTVVLPIPSQFERTGQPETRRRAEPATAAEPPASTGSLFADLSLAPIESTDDAAPAEASVAAAAEQPAAAGFDFSGLTLSLEPLDGEVGDADGATVLVDSAEPDMPPVPVDAIAPTAATERTPLIPRVIVLGASIGGPDALRTFLSGLPENFPALFLLAQHLENGFFSRLATQLQKVSKLPIRVADDGAGPAVAGQVVVVPSHQRYRVDEAGMVEASEHAAPPRYKPCIDELLRDAADVFGRRVTAIIFSGMAGDAIEGAVHVARNGGEVWAQEPESCVVSSMVDGARARGVVEFLGSPRELAEQCVRRYGGGQ